MSAAAFTTRPPDDPYDRLLVAQDGLEGLVLGTQHRKMRPYGVALLGLFAG